MAPRQSAFYAASQYFPPHQVAAMPAERKTLPNPKDKTMKRDKKPEAIYWKNPAPDAAESSVGTPSVTLSAQPASDLVGELERGIAECKKAIAEAEAEEDKGFWRRYWAGYLKAYESLLEKLPALRSDRNAVVEALEETTRVLDFIGEHHRGKFRKMALEGARVGGKALKDTDHE